VQDRDADGAAVRSAMRTNSRPKAASVVSSGEANPRITGCGTGASGCTG
jgi:hypothetical protein